MNNIGNTDEESKGKPYITCPKCGNDSWRVSLGSNFGVDTLFMTSVPPIFNITAECANCGFTDALRIEYTRDIIAKRVKVKPNVKGNDTEQPATE